MPSISPLSLSLSLSLSHTGSSAVFFLFPSNPARSNSTTLKSSLSEKLTPNISFSLTIKVWNRYFSSFLSSPNTLLRRLFHTLKNIVSIGDHGARNKPFLPRFHCSAHKNCHLRRDSSPISGNLEAGIPGLGPLE
ncbi:hypothetical protein RchiOBHm_Chr6g0252281 [Rosa chinensis]|uniref:Uncharacterized protein n=1 Tax=Rosa chinensis TaxID=74649 RepID=A0A2P6PL22_ROSCH|nr:hypothetical protein RchiOBHm_Chr6g0252281 [Rosa chinensis]